MMRLSLPLIVAALFTAVVSATTLRALADAPANPIAPGALDVLKATPAMMGAVSSSMNRKSVTTGNTVTITGSKIMFARADRQTMVNTVRSMILNSEPKTGDTGVTTAILAVLNARADNTKVLRTQIAMALECRDHKEPAAMLEKCIESMVDVAMEDDSESDEQLERRSRKKKKKTPESDSEDNYSGSK